MSRGFDANIYRNLVFACPFKEGSGTLAYDRAKSSLRHTMTLTGTPTWTAAGLGGRVQVLDFNSAHPDYLQCSAAGSTDLDFTSGNFSICAWLYANSLVTEPRIVARGNIHADGYEFLIFANGSIVLVTYQAGTHQYTISSIGAITIGSWHFISTVRIGVSARVYLAGVDNTLTAATHINPLTSARKLHIGIHDDEINNALNGLLYFPRIWSRALTPEEVYYLYQTERGLFGV